MARNFTEWLLTFTDSIANYKYYIDFETIYENAEIYKIELNMMNSLIGSKNIEKDFENLVNKYPEVIKCIPTLLAVRQSEIIVLDDEGNKFEYKFKKMNYSVVQYKIFMRETRLFDLLENHLVNNLYDYVLGVECGLNSNARKNRGGHLMENLVEKFIQKAGLKKGETYFKEMGLETCGAYGTTACLAMLNDAVKKGGVMATSNVGGLSGAFIPVSEDAGMIHAARTGALKLEKLEAMTAVCSVGLDMIVIPGETSASVISGIIADEAAIGMVNTKTTAVRVIPAIGKDVGDELDFGGLLGAGPVMPISQISNDVMINRGGRIPAPLQALKN